MSTYSNRLSVNDLVLHVLQDGTFNIGKIPVQNVLGVHRTKAKAHDRVDEDLGSDPLYRDNILVKFIPNDGMATDVLTKDLVILDRNLVVGQLVKNKQGLVGYVSNLTQTACCRIYEQDLQKRKDPLHELCIFDKPADFFAPLHSYDLGDVVFKNGWLGVVQNGIRNVILNVNFGNGVTQPASIKQLDLLNCMVKGGVTTCDTMKHTAECHFAINGLDGIFVGRRFEIPYCHLNPRYESKSFKWIAPSTAALKEAENNITRLVEVTVTEVKLVNVTVNWSRRADPNGATPQPDNIVTMTTSPNIVTLKNVSHKKPLKVGDIRLCEMDANSWGGVMTRYAWQNCVAKKFYLHKRRSKRPRKEETERERLPQELAKQVHVEIMSTTTKADVIWMTNPGANNTNIDSRDLDPVRYTKYFPGAIISLTPEIDRFDGIGAASISPVNYSVVISSKIQEINFKDCSKWTVQSYRLNPGTVEPVIVGQPSEVAVEKKLHPQLTFWKNDKPQTVVRMRFSTATFEYGKVIGMFPDGRVRIMNEEGEVISVWPTDLVSVNPDSPPVTLVCNIL